MYKNILRALIACALICPATNTLYGMQAKPKPKVFTDQQKIAGIEKIIKDNCVTHVENSALFAIWDNRAQWLTKIPTHRLIKCFTRDGEKEDLDVAMLDRIISEMKDAIAAKKVRDSIGVKVVDLDKQLLQPGAHANLRDERDFWQKCFDSAKGYEDKEVIACGLNKDAWENLLKKNGNSSANFQADTKADAEASHDTEPRPEFEEEFRRQVANQREREDKIAFENQRQLCLAAYQKDYNIRMNDFAILERTLAEAEKVHGTTEEIQADRATTLSIKAQEEEFDKDVMKEFNQDFTPVIINKFFAGEYRFPTKDDMVDRGINHEMIYDLTDKYDQARNPQAAYSVDVDTIAQQIIAEANNQANIEATAEASEQQRTLRRGTMRAAETKVDHAQEQELQKTPQKNVENKRRADGASDDTKAQLDAAAVERLKADAKAHYERGVKDFLPAKKRFIEEFKKSLKADLVNRLLARSKAKSLTPDQLKSVDYEIEWFDIAALYEQFIKQENYKKAAVGGIYARWWKNRKAINEAIAADRREFIKLANAQIGLTASHITPTGEQLYAHAVYANKSRFARIVTLQNLKRFAAVGAIAAIGAYAFYKRATAR